MHMPVNKAEVEWPTGQRLGSAIFGIFLVCFGMPFTLVPFILLPDILSIGELLASIFLICFTIPFLLAGLFVQYLGVSAIRMAINPNSENAQKVFSQRNSRATRTTPTHDVLNYFADETPAEVREKKNREQSMTKGGFWDNVETDPP